LRVHLDSIGAPIVADKLYSGRSVLRHCDVAGPGTGDEVLIERQALHAERLRFRHPHSAELLEITAALPADFERTLAALRKYRPLSAPS
jgi:23S rRNA pseudouridine1911/1915/1917 synthase